MELHERLSAARPVAAAPTARDPFAELKNRVHLAVIGDLGPQLFNVSINPDELRERVLGDIRNQLGDESGISRDDRLRLVDDIADDILGHGPIERLLADDTVSEIMVNGPFDVWVERAGRLSQTSVRFNDESHLRRIINKMVAQVGRRIDESSPMVDARLPDGSRVNAIIPPLSLSGPLVTIRKFSKARLGLEDMVPLGTISTQTLEFLERAVLARLNILISGGTGSGKTTLLNAMSSAVPDNERIVTIEDAAELRLNQRHVLRLESRPKNIEGEGEIPIRELVRNSLRMRPDRIIVGEVRGPETLDMLQAMNTGHDGSLSTVHANSPRDALSRLETMVLMAGFDLPIRAIRQQVASALDLIVHIERVEDGSRHVTAVTEVQGMESDVITLQELFEFKMSEVNKDGVVVGELVPTGLRPSSSASSRSAASRCRSACSAPRTRTRWSSAESPRADETRRPPARRCSLARARRGRRRGRRGRRRQHHADGEQHVPEQVVHPLAAGEGHAEARPGQRSPRTALPSPACRSCPRAPVRAARRVRCCAARRRERQHAGKAIAAAMNAARAFVAQRAPGQQIAFVTFNSKTNVVLPLTKTGSHDRRGDRPTADPCLRDAHVRQRRHPWSTLLSAANLDSASIVLLSDGADTGSGTSLQKTLAAARAAHVRIYTVGLHSKKFDPSSLQALAAGANGAYAEAQPSELAGLYHSLGAQLAGQYLVRYQSFAGPKQPVTVRIRVKGIPGVAKSHYDAPPLAEIALPKTFHRTQFARLVMSPYTAIGVVLVCALLAGVALASALTPTHNHLRKRMAEFVSMATPREDRPAAR